MTNHLSLKLVDKFTYLGSSVSSTEKDIDTRLTKTWTAIDKLSIIWKSDMPDKMKRSFFQAAVGSILLYGCTTREEARRQLNKNVASNIEQVLAVTPHKAPTIRPRGGARGVMVIVVVKWTRRHEFKSWTRLIAFHIALILLGKVWIQLFSLQLWVNSRADYVLQPWCGN